MFVSLVKAESIKHHQIGSRICTCVVCEEMCVLIATLPGNPNRRQPVASHPISEILSLAFWSGMKMSYAPMVVK